MPLTERVSKGVPRKLVKAAPWKVESAMRVTAIHFQVGADTWRVPDLHHPVGDLGFDSGYSVIWDINCRRVWHLYLRRQKAAQALFEMWAHDTGSGPRQE